MSQTIIPTFAAINSTLTFLKPELRVFVSDVFASQGRPFTPQSFLTLIDIEGEKRRSESSTISWTDEERMRFYIENFSTPYDIIECSAKQLSAVMITCGVMPSPNDPLLAHSDCFPKVLIIHANDNMDELVLPSDRIGFFIVVGDIQKFRVMRDDPGLIVFHKLIKSDRGASFTLIGSAAPVIPLYYTHYKISPNDPRIASELGGLFRPSGTGGYQSLFPNALIRQFNQGEDLDDGKEIYTITDMDRPKGFTQYASIIAPPGGKISIPNIDKREDGASEETRRSIIVHGRIAASKLQSMIEMDTNRKLFLIFPDMSQKEVDSLLFNQSILFGNDRRFSSERGMVKYAPALYLGDGLTFAEQILTRRIPSAAGSPRSGISDSRDPLFPSSDSMLSSLSQSELDQHHSPSFTCLSYIDNYFNTVQLKHSNGFFAYMITKYAAELEAREINFALLRDKPSTYTLVACVKERLQNESKVDSNRRQIMLGRIKALVKQQTPIDPYYLERAIDDPELSEEQRFRDKHQFSGRHDPETQERKYYKLNTSTDDAPYRHVITGVSYMVLDGKDYDAIIHNCGFVILRGTGKVRVSGTLHSLVCYGGVEIKLDNVSPMLFKSDVFLFMENGSIYDTIANYENNLPKTVIDRISDLRVERTEKNGIPVFPDVPAEAPANPTESFTPARSIIRNLYVSYLPVNHLTAMIETIVKL